MNGEKILGTSKIGPKYRITLIDFVRKKLGVKIGDLIVYVEDERENVILRASKMK